MRIPFIDRAGYGIDSPANEDAELGVLEPLRDFVVAQSLPVGTVGAIVCLLIGLLQQVVAARIEFGDGILPFLVDLPGGLDTMRGGPGIGGSGGLGGRSQVIAGLGGSKSGRGTKAHEQEELKITFHCGPP